MKEIKIRMKPLATPRKNWISDEQFKERLKERARLQFLSQFKGLPCEHQDLPTTEEGLFRGYWRPSIQPSRVKGNNIYYQC